MYSIDVKEMDEAFWHSPRSTNHNVGVMITIKMMSTLKLHYPDGIEIDLPRTYRSVYQHRFDISCCTQVFLEHWNWLIDAIQKNYSYSISFDHGEAQRSISHADRAITFEVAHLSSYRESYEQSRFYLPLEYCRDDFIVACQKIIDIYRRYQHVVEFDKRTPKMLATLAISPLELPRFYVETRDANIIVTYHQSHYKRPRKFQLLHCDIRPFRSWIDSNLNRPVTLGMTYDYGDNHSLRVRVSEKGIYVQDSHHRIIEIPQDQVPCLLAALPT